MVNVIIDGIAVRVPEGTTIMEAAAKAGITIPSLCYLKEINEIGACRVCCVEVEGEERLVSSCNNLVYEGRSFKAHFSSIIVQILKFSPKII